MLGDSSQAMQNGIKSINEMLEKIDEKIKQLKNPSKPETAEGPSETAEGASETPVAPAQDQGKVDEKINLYKQLKYCLNKYKDLISEFQKLLESKNPDAKEEIEKLREKINALKYEIELVNLEIEENLDARRELKKTLDDSRNTKNEETAYNNAVTKLKEKEKKEREKQEKEYKDHARRLDGDLTISEIFFVSEVIGIAVLYVGYFALIGWISLISHRNNRLIWGGAKYTQKNRRRHSKQNTYRRIRV